MQVYKLLYMVKISSNGKWKTKWANGARFDHLFVGASKWIDNWDKQIFSTHSPVKVACKSIHHGMTIKLQTSLNIPSDQSFGIYEGVSHRWIKAV